MRLLFAAASVASVAMMAACAPDRGAAYDAAFADAEREFHGGRWKTAAAAWEGAAQKAHRVRDRDEARFLEARALERAGAWQEARAIYVTLAESKDGSRDGPRRGRAHFELASLEIEHGDVEKGFAMLEAAARQFPQHGLAGVALKRLLVHAQEKGGEPRVMALLDAQAPVFKGTEQEGVILYERAASLERSGRTKEAHDAYLASSRAHLPASGGLVDDGFWIAAQIDEEAGRYEEAIQHLKELLDWREPSGFWWSYERPRYARAALHIGEIYLDKLKDRAKAQEAFARVADFHKWSAKRDDALWGEARLARQGHDEGATCKLAKNIAEDFKDSRYAPCLHVICGSLAAQKRECPDYLLRQLAADLGQAPPLDAEDAPAPRPSPPTTPATQSNPRR